MSQTFSVKLRREIAERAGYRCEYCLMPEHFSATIFHIDHIRSRKHGGPTTTDNLAYACPHCNQNKGSDVATLLDDDEQTVRFFNPRKDKWSDHFKVDKGEILPKTPIGKATVTILNVNQIERVILRATLIAVGQYEVQ